MSRFISCDWGSTRFRLRLSDTQDPRVLASVEDDRGCTAIAGALGPRPSPEARDQAFRAIATEQIDALAAQSGESLDGAPLVVSGMATSAHGWRELAYATVPFDLEGRKAVFTHFEIADPPRPVYMLSGLRTECDVMRGEETQIVGLFALPQYRDHAADGMVVMPGTHSKHVRIREGRIVDFRTCLTGELYDILSHHSVLRFGLETPDTDWADIEETMRGADHGEAFDEGVREAQRGSLIGDVFKVRVQGLLGSHTHMENAEYLSGILIGSEIQDLLAFYPQGPVILCAASRLSTRYARAFQQLNQQERLEIVAPETVEDLAMGGHAAFLERREA